MNTRNDTGFRTFLVGAGGVTRHTRVKLDTGAIVTAGAGEDAIGIVLSTEAAGAYAPVKLWSASGTFCATSAGAVVLNAAIYGAASGQIDDAVAGNKIGVALEAASGAGQDIEFLPANVADLFAAAAHVADATQTQAALVDNGGGTADGTVAAQAAPVTLTDSSGLSGGHSDTVAATPALVTVTDSSGLHASHSDTVAATPALVTVTDSSGLDASHSDTINPAAAGGCAGGATPANTDVDTAIATAVLPLTQNDSSLGQKLIELVTREGVTAQNVSNLGQKLIELVTREGVTAQNVSSVTQKVVELVTLAGVQRDNMKEITTQLAAVKVDVAAMVAKFNTTLANLENNGIHLAS